MTYTIVVHYAKPHGNYLRTGGRKRQPQLDNLGLADWQLSGELKGSFGSMAVLTAEARRVLQFP